MRLVDADELKAWADIVPYTPDGGIDVNDFIKKLDSMPTVDAVEVIRCKYCKYSIDFYDEGDCYCRRPNRALELVGDWDFYCKAAERREDGQTD